MVGIPSSILFFAVRFQHCVPRSVLYTSPTVGMEEYYVYMYYVAQIYFPF